MAWMGMLGELDRLRKDLLEFGGLLESAIPCRWGTRLGKWGDLRMRAGT